MLKIQTTSKPFSVTFKDGLLDAIELKVHSIEVCDNKRVIILTHTITIDVIYSDIENMRRCFRIYRDTYNAPNTYDYKASSTISVAGRIYECRGMFPVEFTHTNIGVEFTAQLTLRYDECSIV